MGVPTGGLWFALLPQLAGGVFRVHKLRLLLTLAVLVGGIVMLSPGASAVPPEVRQATSSFEYTKNLHP
jgi:hypothetical protein